ncbi:MAG: hypothetical protein-transmembrane region and signal peptide prediction [uncultured Solirubrobacteraceae bacterium]|uniref:DUF1772 domain-containing protein n=1 Tax=uncultured Solirubrobacteraceae bacterium TaxID=1162706 RepID=A0A6J4RSW3_9ACTN|nr:MAG: hypothetical protein-transmembrane region and signal peptide prediction [uncultured Solirubrobacteraceae bacterium]
MTLLLLNAAAVLFMTGVIWFVQLVHYPLFGKVGAEAWPTYHREHSRRTTWVVIAPMSVDLLTSLALVVIAPAGVSPVLIAGGALAAVVTWAATGLLAVPAHRDLGDGWQAGIGRRLTGANWVRTTAWSAHSALVLAALAQAA